MQSYHVYPSMYAEGGKEPIMCRKSSAEEIYSDDVKTQDSDQWFGKEGIKEEEHDRCGFKQDSIYNKSEEQAVFAHGMGQDSTYYNGDGASSPDEASFYTRDTSSPDKASVHAQDPHGRINYPVVEFLHRRACNRSYPLVTFVSFCICDVDPHIRIVTSLIELVLKQSPSIFDPLINVTFGIYSVESE